MNTQAAQSPAAPASGSASTGNASAAAAAALAAGLAGAKPATGPARTPGLEQLSPSEIFDEFMGSPAGAGADKPKDGPAKKVPEAKPDPKKGDGDSDEDEDSDDDGDSDEDEDGDDDGDSDEDEDGDDDGDSDEDEDGDDDGDSDEDEDGDDDDDSDEDEDGGEKSDLEKGLLKALKDKPGLHKRIKAIFGERKQLRTEVGTLKQQLESITAQPPLVLQPGSQDPLANLTTVEAVDKAVTAMETEARQLIKWLAKHEETGGTWDEGGPNEQEMSAKEVASALRYYEDMLAGGAKKLGDGRKAWLTKYGATAKTVGEKAKAFTDANANSREAVLLRTVPELLRDPEYLQVLADAEAGRMMREKAAKGIKFVEVDPKKVREKEPKNSAPARGSKPTGGKPSAAPAAAAAKPLTQEALSDLRSRAAKGDRTAKDAIFEAFVTG